MNHDVVILRELAEKYFEIAYNDKNAIKMKLHKNVNDLKAERPAVLIEEIPWSEMNIDNELTILCQDKFLQGIEFYMRSIIYRNKHMPADMIVRPYIPVSKIIESTGNGLSVQEETIFTDKENGIISHKYFNILQNDEDIEKIHNPVITYNQKKTLENYNLIGEILGDILPVRLVGVGAYYVTPWDDVSRYCGVTELLMNLIERPDFMHRIIKKLTEASLSWLTQLEELDLLDRDPYDLHCTCARTDDLPSKDYEEGKLTRKDIWGRGAAQIFGSVSKEMHDEFDIAYMKQTIGQCGLSYYGCCEPLDKKMDIVEKLPNLRKVSITPWADVNIAAEAINHKYVLASKPNPSSVAVPVLDRESLKKEITNILQACKKNGCSCDIVLKDISTCCKRPENLFEWEKIVMDLVENA